MIDLTKYGFRVEARAPQTEVKSFHASSSLDLIRYVESIVGEHGKLLPHLEDHEPFHHSPSNFNGQEYYGASWTLKHNSQVEFDISLCHDEGITFLEIGFYNLGGFGGKRCSDIFQVEGECLTGGSFKTDNTQNNDRQIPKLKSTLQRRIIEGEG